MRSFADWQMPFWNPWYCGGNVLWQNPQVSVISPVYLMSLVMPLGVAMKLNVLAHYVAGFAGMHLLIRRIVGVKSPAVVIYCGALFAFSGGLALHTRAGHVNFLPVLLLPAVLYCFFRAASGHLRGVLYGGAIVAVAVLNGGVHVLPLAAILVGTLGLAALLVTRTIKPIVVAVGIVIAAGMY